MAVCSSPVCAKFSSIGCRPRDGHDGGGDGPSSDSVPPAQARVFDDLYAAVAAGEGISGALLRTLNETNKALLPELTRLQLKVAQSQIERQAKQKVRPPPIEIEGLPEIP